MYSKPMVAANNAVLTNTMKTKLENNFSCLTFRVLIKYVIVELILNPYKRTKKLSEFMNKAYSPRPDTPNILVT
jgi:hypothetical protein